jgi:hypothetical protein
MPHKIKPVEERFFSKIEKTDSCWTWTGSKDRKGYGRIMVGSKPCLAHRVSYEIRFGPVTKGLFVCHSCDNPTCVNPDHLWLGTNRDNAYDMMEKGRWKQPPVLPGEANPLAKLTREAVIEIRSVKGNTKALAHKYGVSITAIKRARTGAGWKE